jgi:alpha/beta superfamily hydrolase
MKRDLVIPSGEEILGATLYGRGKAGVVLCPPNPAKGGNRDDKRLVAIAEKLAKCNILALCFDYRDYTEGLREVEDAISVIDYLKERAGKIGLYGYAFGAVVASNAAIFREVDAIVFQALFKHTALISTRVDQNCPKLFIHGLRDEAAEVIDLEYLYKIAREPKQKVLLETDHFFEDKINEVAEITSAFFKKHLL